MHNNSKLKLFIGSLIMMKVLSFTSLSMVFQSYQDNDRMIMKECEQGNPIHGG